MELQWLIGFMLFLLPAALSAQIKISGNVYGGGNEGEVKGSTNVTVLAGDIGAPIDDEESRPMSNPKGKVFGGARMANVGGNSFVHIDGEHASDYIVINQVYGGNDIAGKIGTAADIDAAMPAQLTEVKRVAADDENPRKNAIDDTYNSYVRVSTKTSSEAVFYTASEIADAASKPRDPAWGKTIYNVKTPAVPATDAKHVYIGQLFGGGNGGYYYTQSTAGGKTTHYIYADSTMTKLVESIVTDEGDVGFQLPEIDKTYLEIVGGSIVYAYGGGNNATVKEKTVIHMDNPSEVVNHIYVDGNGIEDPDATESSHAGLTDLLSTERFKEMGINTAFSKPSSDEFQIGRFFGGNNLAEMAIRPTWNLLGGKIRNVYSGGNRGAMTSPEGLLLEIPQYSDLVADYIYGGCRMADVKPTVNGVYTPCSNLPGYYFPNELSARVLVRGGDINTVYGGNDVTGRVYGGNAIGIYSNIRGNIYGGGNGAYPYTDKPAYQTNETYGDLYYALGNGDLAYSPRALNAYRPNAEQVSIRLAGTDADHPTIIKGSVYVGGNCSALSTQKSNPMVELKIGSYVIADSVFLGNNGLEMVDTVILKHYAEEGFSDINMTNENEFADYMEGVAMPLLPDIVFDNTANGDPATYEPYSSYIGSFYCGGNVGSMTIPGKNVYRINNGLNIYNKFVGGCNNAYVPEQFTSTGTKLNAVYDGGVLGSKAERPTFADASGNIKDRLEINLENLTITPLRWHDPVTKDYPIWNTNIWSNEEGDFVSCPMDASNGDIRLLGGNVYGGCYNSGHVNGNVVININENVMLKDEVFGSGPSRFNKVASGVKFEKQRDDLMAVALAVFGGGYGEGTEIWGSTTVNLNKGYAFQIYGGGEKGIVGKKNVEGEYVFDSRYSSTVNLNSRQPVYSSTGTVEDLAETEYIYGGGNEGDVCGNTYVNLGNGRIYDAFGGASDADILGHTEVYIGRQPNGSGGFKDGFPWICDIVYGGNDFGGKIWGEYEDDYNFTARLRDYATDGASLHGLPTEETPGLLKSASYVAYLQGRVDTIFGGNYGYYDYSLEMFKDEEGNEPALPRLESSFVNIRPKSHDQNAIKNIFGGSTGYPGNRDCDNMQDRSYVLIDIPDGTDKFVNTEVFGAGAYNGVGMSFTKEETLADGFDLDQASAIVDLLHGQVSNTFGGSYNEGNTRRTVINVPERSTVSVGNIFGGAYGTQTLPPCDVYESNVNYRSDLATVRGAIYGGNNNERRTLYTHVNIYSPVWQNKESGYLATVYGAGRGEDSWSEYTEVNLENGARLFEVYGGGENGHVVNTESIRKYMKDGYAAQGCASVNDPKWLDAWTLGDYYKPASSSDFDKYLNNSATNLTNSATVRTAEMDDRDYSAYTDAEREKREYRYNTNVIIKEGAYVANYAYGGGLGTSGTLMPGDVWGSTYIALLGGEVKKDIYAAGTVGNVCDQFLGGVGLYDADSNPGGFMASANAYIKGGSCRNVYGGGWQGNVGAHIDPSTDSSTEDITIAPTFDMPGETHVVIGDLAGTSFTNGIPTVQRNAYGGGEGEQGVNGGMIFGTAHLTLNNGYVGYYYNAEGTDNPKTAFDERYIEKIEDDTQATPNTLLTDAGCMFGGGYTDNSYVDKTKVYIYGGHVRNSAFGGGEIAAIGRGTMNRTTSGGKTITTLEGIYRPGKTLLKMYGGQVHKNVYGGGRGYDNLSRVGTLNSSGYVFGQTEVHIHGGEIGTVAGVADGDGNVFGGGDEGFVYSAYENPDGSFGKGVKDGIRYDGTYQGYYYQHDWNGGDFVTVKVGEKEVDDGKGGKKTEDIFERQFTEDCKVLVEPHMKVTSPVTINSHYYETGQYVPTSDLDALKNKTKDTDKWSCLDASGIIIHNAVFAGGNTPSGSSTTSANTTTVFGNATASVRDIYHRDMITLGTRHTGGLYGDGNLTLVDGYRELNITNYGTDYYSIAKEISIGDYKALPDREADYYELRYTCIKECKDKDDTRYKPESVGDDGITIKASTITADEMQNLFVEEVTDPQTGKVKKQSVEYGGVAVLIFNEEEGEWVPNPAAEANFWKESGVLPVYAGRLMNSIQRADFCGVFGSRMVMQGAKDRVPEEADYTNYTINRVREVSLNKKESIITSDYDKWDSDGEGHKAGEYKEKDAPLHGNYFGIYNIVNYLGALTSDVDFGHVRKTDNTTDDTKYKSDITIDESTYAYGSANATYYNWKQAHIKDRTRNNGSSHNKVALASGVYLELTTEESTGDGLYEKVWGPITGVIELDLINVSTGIGGGFVYAKNQHGVRSASGHENTTLTALNDNAVTQWDYDYSTTETDTYQKEWETSGNFVHSTQTIIDDCYNISNRYMGTGKMPAHFWYIKGSTYVYDQYISAYTGTTNAYSETVDIPLTIAAASHGRMKLLDVQPNRYAYYSAPGVKLEEGKRIVINDKSYYLNDPISYWDWYLLSRSEKDLFVDSTYTNCVSYKLNGELHEAGSVIMSKTEFRSFMDPDHEYLDANNDTIRNAEKEAADDNYIFRLSNNASHNTGYLLTFELNNPSIWDNWYTLKNGDYRAKKALAEYQALSVVDREKYYDGPTYRLDPSKISGTGILLGQQSYTVGELITKSVETTYQAAKTAHSDAIPSGQAEFEQAFLVTDKITVIEDGKEHHYNPGVAVSKTFATSYTTQTDTAYLCTNSIQVTKDNVIYKDSKVTATERTSYINDVKGQMNAISSGAGALTLDAIKSSATLTATQKSQLTPLATLRDELTNNLVPAYYCETAGLYGGNYYETGQSYRGLEAWSSLSSTDRKKFIFNYDAFDLLIDPYYDNREGEKYQYDGNYDSEAAVRNPETGNKAGYSVTQSVDYTASYNDADHTLPVTSMTVKRDGTPTTTTTLQKDDELTREQYESLPNEQRHYSPIAVKSDVDTYYVVHTAFQIGSTPYAVGETISSDSYTGLPSTEQGYVTQLKFTGTHEDQIIYYCRESYEGNTAVTAFNSSVVAGAVDHTVDGKSVSLGTVINSGQYAVLPNDQRHFTIHGISPTETSTLYVARESNIYDLSQEKIITVVYEYDYDETDGTGNVTPISERHVVNIHLTFKSGVPTVDNITPPSIILPGDYTTLGEPRVTPGAYEITGGGWELFETQRDAESHSNGVDYEPSFDPLYWYQDGFYVAYYAKSYLGRTYSNAVPVSVANYHDLADVMAHKGHHMHIDNVNVKRKSKIYVNDYSALSKNGLDLLKDLFDLSVLDGSTVERDAKTDTITSDHRFKGHALLNSHVREGQNLEFFLRTDIDHSVPSGSATWAPIAPADGSTCFEGILHGDGHTISGLDHSLFGRLCGSVYNLGVTGSFTTAGIADEGDGYVESCWVKSSAESTTADPKPYPVFGNPTDGTGHQVVNSYFWNGNKTLYKTVPDDGRMTYENGSHGTVMAMTGRDFYNGTLAYDLNNFYLYKRYNDHTAPGSSAAAYQYFKKTEDGTLSDVLTGYYADNASLCSSGYSYTPDGKTESVTLQYVEDRFADGDYRYAAGSIPSSEDERYWIEIREVEGKDVEIDRYSPIWPDDYIFFGQKLTYDYNTAPHQDVPTAVARDGGRLSLNDDANRVYRAPAYYRSKAMGVAHFNPKAYLAQKSADGTHEAYPDMTAIDFAGHNGANMVNGTYTLGNAGTWFYEPLLDDDGLTGIRNCDETQNLLVYAPATTGEGYTNPTTHAKLTAYFVDPAFTDDYDDAEGYRRVRQNTATVYGHLVQGNRIATSDHLLVDKQDFNAPIDYTFDGSHRMWYQRTPSDNEFVNYSADHTTGWQGISVPFTAELVTTDTKGEITHFYGGSESSKNNTGTKVGHEYWLRNLTDIKMEGDPEVAKAYFRYPSVGDGSVVVNKTVTNTFLWDYYYENEDVHDQKDRNSDTYLEYRQYYKTARTYDNYPLLTAARPYLIGLPGQAYYEFDLSGKFTAQNTAAAIDKLAKQTVTLASATGEHIGVSDDDTKAATTANTHNGYAFMPTYMRQTIAAGDNTYTMSAAGDSYDKVPAAGEATVVEPFRPYFAAASAGARAKARRIVFNSIGNEFGQEQESEEAGNGNLVIASRPRHIIVKSSLKEPRVITITNGSGIRLTTFTINPGQTIDTNVHMPGLYIVNTTKIAVR